MLWNFINKISVAHLKVFESVYRLKSMTLAAQELHLTQSGVSQHMNHLENDLGVDLFARNQKKLFPTEMADRLYSSCFKAFEEIESTLASIKDPKQKELSGRLRIGMPTEFGNNIAIPFLAEWCKKHKNVKLDFIYGYGLSLMQQLEKQEIDLAFIDSIPKSKKVDSHVVFQETLNLAATKEYLRQMNFSSESYKNLVTLDYIEYEHKESIIRNWFHYNYNKQNAPLKIRAWAMSVQGVTSLIRQSMGAGILPHHLIEKLHKQGVNLHLFKGRKAVMTNDISIAWLKGIPRSQAVDELLKYTVSKTQLRS